MWICSKCGEDVEDDFDVCWSCGTSREGRQDPQFQRQSEGIIEDATYQKRDLANPQATGILDEHAFRLARDAQPEEPFVTVATFGNAPEAYMVRSRLEAEGITAFVMNELAVTTWGVQMDPIRLQVAENDADRARAILANLPRLSPVEDSHQQQEEEYQDNEEEDEEEDEEEGEEYESDGGSESTGTDETYR